MRLRSAMLSAILLLGQGCSQELIPDSTGAQRIYAAKGITAISVSGPDTVQVRQGSGGSVRATGSPAALDVLQLRRTGGTLEIDRSGTAPGPVAIVVETPGLTGLTVRGAGGVKVDRLQTPSLRIEVAGAGSVGIARLQVGKLDVRTTGSGDVTLGGQAREVSLLTMSAGNINAAALQAGGGSTETAGTGSIRLASDGDVFLHIMGAGNIDVVGKAQCRIADMAAGEAKCRR